LAAFANRYPISLVACGFKDETSQSLLVEIIRHHLVNAVRNLPRRKSFSKKGMEEEGELEKGSLVFLKVLLSSFNPPNLPLGSSAGLKLVYSVVR